MSKQQQQQQQQGLEEEERIRRQEYEAAQRDAIESILVGRATTEAVEQQGEQLKRSELLADDTQYKLDKATRLLKGMTWSGWVSNLFAGDVKAPESLSASSELLERKKDGEMLLPSLDHYENLPPACQGAAQAVKNYHANVTVLLQCETEEQKETCVQICDTMYAAAAAQLQTQLNGKSSSLEAYALQLKSDLQVLRKRQLASQSQVRGLVDLVTSTPPRSGNSPHQSSDKHKEELFGRKPASSSLQTVPVQSPATTKTTPTKSVQEQMQDDHLQVLAASLGELGHIAHSLNAGLRQQGETIDSLDSKSESVLETSKMVGRRADRLIQKKSWTPVKAVFSGNVALRHAETGKYLSVLGSDLYLVNRYNPANCTFGLHKRQGAIVGLQAHSNRKWVGQSFLTGSLTCSAGTFGRREEWETDPDWTATRLLCASAGWGQGGYLQARSADFAILIGGSTVPESKSAAKWSIVSQDTEEGRRDAHASP